MIEDKLNQLNTLIQQLQANTNQLNENIKGENSFWAKLDNSYSQIISAKRILENAPVQWDDAIECVSKFANTVDNIRDSFVSSSMKSDQFKQANMNLIQTCNQIWKYISGNMVIIQNNIARETELQLSEKLLTVEKAVQNKEISEEKASKLVQKIKNSDNGTSPDLTNLLNEYSKKLSKDETSVTSEKVELQSKCFDEKNIDIIDTYIKNIENLNAKVEEVNANYQTKNNDEILNIIFKGISTQTEVLLDRVNPDLDVCGQINIRLNQLAEIYQEKNQIDNNNIDQAINDATVQATITNGYSINEMFELHQNCTDKLINDIATQTQGIYDLQENIPSEITPLMAKNLQSELNNQKEFFQLYMNNSNVRTAEQNASVGEQIQTISIKLNDIEKGVTV